MDMDIVHIITDLRANISQIRPLQEQLIQNGKLKEAFSQLRVTLSKEQDNYLTGISGKTALSQQLHAELLRRGLGKNLTTKDIEKALKK